MQDNFPSKIIRKLAWSGKLNGLSDEQYLRVRYRAHFHRCLDLEHPVRLSEKIQYLKLYDHRPEYTRMVDKIACKQIIRDKVGQQYVVPLLGSWSHFNEIDRSMLPEQFVLKCNHDSGSTKIIDRNTDWPGLEKWFEDKLKRNYYWVEREWPYKDVKPMLMAEPLLAVRPTNYKIFCVNGQPQMIMTSCRKDKTYVDFYDLTWKKLPVALEYYDNSEQTEPVPKELGKMLEIARILAKDIPFLRVDLYDVNGKIWCGELTLYGQGAGFYGFKPEEVDVRLGAMLDLSMGQK